VNIPLKIRLGDDPLALVLSGVLPFGGYVTIQCQAYFDESASHDGAPVLCIAGLIFKKSEANKLGREWRKVLHWKNLPYFRMVECAHGNGPFANLSKPERVEVATRMIEIIKRHAVQAIAITVDNRDFTDVMAEYPRAGRLYKAAYAFCTHSVLIGVRTWIYANPKVAQMAYFFEDGHASAGQAKLIMDDLFSYPEKCEVYRYAGYGFVPKQKSYAVQAADLLAWQWYKDKKNQAEGRARRKDCASLLQLHHNAVHLDRAGLINILENGPVLAPLANFGPLTPFPPGTFGQI
jgi:hypothetical protein